MLTAVELREVVRYDPDSGHFYRIKNAKKHKDVPCGHLTDRGYVGMSILCRSYVAHRLAWLYVHGDWPAEEIDHINGDRTDNRLSNLRACTRAENSKNKGDYKNNKLGVKGVYWDKARSKFRASIRVNGKLILIGKFPTSELASDAYKEASIKYFGEFSCQNR